MSELKPCPYCGSEDVHVFGMTGECCVMCFDCLMKGPRKKSKRNITAAWNALPRPLRWMKEPPTEPGWYWLRQASTKGLVQIVRACGEELPYNWEDAEWAGPIQEPVE